MRNKTEEVEDDDLMVMFVKPSNPSQSGDSGAEHTSIPSSSKTFDHSTESIVPKPVVTVTKTTENCENIFCLLCLKIICTNFI